MEISIRTDSEIFASLHLAITVLAKAGYLFYNI